VVTNGDFRDWRAQNGHGGDFLVFSDMAITTLSPPDTFCFEDYEKQASWSYE
jgi:hypothetical protein